MFPPLPVPIRVGDGLRLDIDPGASGTVLTPAEALGLGETLIRHAVRRTAELRQENARALKVALGGTEDEA